MAFRPGPFPRISPKSYRHNACPNRFSSRFSTSRTNAPRSLSHLKVDTHSTLLKESHTTAHTAKQGAFLPRPQRGLELPAKLILFHRVLYTYISRFSVNPQHQQKRKIRQSCRHKFYPQPLFIAFFNFSHKWPTFAFTGESGDALGFAQRIAHSGSHAETGGVSDGGAVTLGTNRTFPNLPWPGIRTANFAAFGSWPGVLPKNAESLRDSDALMRVAVPRRRGPAGLRDLLCFCRNCDLYAMRTCARQGRYHYPRYAPRAAETLDGRFLRSSSRH